MYLESALTNGKKMTNPNYKEGEISSFFSLTRQHRLFIIPLVVCCARKRITKTNEQ